MHGMVAMVEAGDEFVPVPGFFKADVAHGAFVLGDHPFQHELLERHFALMQRRVVIHRRAGERLEQAEGAPEGHVENLLGALGVVLHQHFDRGEAALRVAGFVGLDAGEQVGEIDVAGFHRIGRKGHELDVGKAMLNRQAGGDGGFHAVGIQHAVIEEIADRDDRPFIGVEGFLAPVEARVVLQQVVREGEVELGMADFVEHAVDAEIAPARRGREAAEARLHGDRHLLDEAGGAHVHHG